MDCIPAVELKPWVVPRGNGSATACPVCRTWRRSLFLGGPPHHRSNDAQADENLPGTGTGLGENGSPPVQVSTVRR